MIVDSMTHKEVFQELDRDREALSDWWRNKMRSHFRQIAKCRQFPMKISFDYTSKRKIRYYISTVFLDRHTKRYMSTVIAFRWTAEGLTTYTSRLCKQPCHVLKVHTPHFWKRYAERAKVNKSGFELVKHFFDRNALGRATDEERLVPRSVRYNGDLHISGCTPDGVMLGALEDGYYIARTFITYDMCTGRQQKQFSNLRNNIVDYDSAYNEMTEDSKRIDPLYAWSRGKKRHLNIQHE